MTCRTSSAARLFCFCVLATLTWILACSTTSSGVKAPPKVVAVAVVDAGPQDRSQIRFVMEADLPDGGVERLNLAPVKGGPQVENIEPPPATHPPEVRLAQLGALPDLLTQAITACRKNPQCHSLQDIVSSNPLILREFQTWCTLRGYRAQAGADASSVVLPLDAGVAEYETTTACQMVMAVPEDDAGTSLSAMSIADLSALGEAAPPPTWNCDGWGLMLPAMSVRHTVRGGRTVFTGPIASGLGAGYFWSMGHCDDNWTVGPSLSFFSQALTIGTNVQLGVAAGFELAIHKPFQFRVGLAQGFDLVRYVKGDDDIERVNSVFSGYNRVHGSPGNWYRANSVWLFTITLETGPTSTSDGGT